MLDALIFADLSPEDDPILGVLHRTLQRVTTNRDRLGTDQDALRVQAVEDIAKALALLADPIGFGDEQVIDEDRIGIDGLAAHLLDLADLDRGTVEIGIEDRDAVGRLAAILELGRPRRGPDLLAGDPVAARNLGGEGLDRGRVEAGIRFGEAEAALIFAGDQPRNPACLLFRGAIDDDGMRAEEIDMDARCRRHAAAVAGDFAHHDHGFGQAEARAAIFLGHGDAEPAAFSHRAMEFKGKFTVGIALQPIIVAESLDDGADAGADRLVVFVDRKIHLSVPPCRVAQA